MQAGKNFGLMVGIVSDRQDPDGLGRVKFTLPTHDDQESDWTRVAVPFGGSAGSGHGHQWIPEKGDEVLVGFVNGDPKVAIVVASLYSKKQPPPTKQPDERIFKSRKGHIITISDVDGSEKIEIATQSGQKVTVDEAGKTITVKASTKVVIDAPDVELAGDGGTHPLVLGDQLLTMFNGHTHAVAAFGTSGPPVPLLTGTVLSQSTKVKS
jgi:phage baseplate assembly protein V